MAELYFNTNNNNCVGSSSNGWRIMVEDESPSIYATDSLEKFRVELPSLLSFPDVLQYNGNDEYVCLSFLGTINMSSKSILHKVVLSKDPTQAGCVAVAIFGKFKRLAFCRVWEDTWNVVDDSYGYEDVVFDERRGRFFAVTYDGVMTTWDNSVTPLLMEYVFDETRAMPLRSRGEKKYLIFDNTGQLMMVNRYNVDNEEDSDCDGRDESAIDDNTTNFDEDDEDGKTSRFGVFILNEEKGELEEIYGLQGEVLLLENNQVMFSS